MGLLIEFVFEFLAEIFVEGYLRFFVYLTESFSSGGTISEKTQKVMSVCIAIAAMVVACGMFVGIGLVAEDAGKTLLGWHLVGAGVAYLTLGVVMKLFQKKRKRK